MMEVKIRDISSLWHSIHCRAMITVRTVMWGDPH